MAIRITMAAAFAAGLPGLLAGLISSSWLVAVLASLLGAVSAVYLMVLRLTRDRLVRLEEVLDQIGRASGAASIERAQGDDELDELTRKADRLGTSIRRRLEAIHRAADFRREFVGDVSHEIKTPIFAIQGFAETLLDGALNDERVNRQFVEKILGNARRLAALAGDLSDISRLESRTPEIEERLFDVRAAAEEARTAVEMAAAEKDIVLRVVISDEAPTAIGDRDRIVQVLTNLAHNGIKYNNPGGEVEISAHPEDGAVRFVVRDNGIGISVKDLSRITERFYRVDKSRSRSDGGSGLGLSIVKHILAAHGQKLSVKSQPGAGSAFSFVLRSGQQS